MSDHPLYLKIQSQFDELERLQAHLKTRDQEAQRQLVRVCIAYTAEGLKDSMGELSALDPTPKNIRLHFSIAALIAVAAVKLKVRK